MNEFHYQYLPNRPVDIADVVILPVPHEWTVSYRGGTRNGPEAILSASEQLEYYEEDGQWSPFKHMGVCVLPADEKRLYERDVDFHERLRRHAAELPENALFMALGGEHSITPGLVAGRMPTPGTVVLLDAHGDLRTTFEGTPLSHACPMHHIREQGHRIVMAGIRSLHEDEAKRIRDDEAITCFTDRELRRPDRREALLETLRGIEGPVYLTVDLDAFNPAEVPGVGTPQPGGIDWYLGLDVIEAVVLNERVELRGCDIVELVPDANCVSDMFAAKLTQKIISAWGRRQGYPERPTNGSQSEVDYE